MAKGSSKGKRGGGSKIPELTGSPKQITWANDIREHWMHVTTVENDDFEKIKSAWYNVKEALQKYSTRKMPDLFLVKSALEDKISKETPKISKGLDKDTRTKERQKRNEKIRSERNKILKKYIKKRREIVLQNMTKASDWIDIR